MTTSFSNAFGFLVPLATTPAGQNSNGSADWFPAVDILEDAQEYLLKIDLPEVEPAQIHVFVEGDSLVICGERQSPSLEDKQCLRVERPRGHFERRFALPDDASRGDIEPLLRGCVLELHLRKVYPDAPPDMGKGRPSKLMLRGRE